MMSPNFYTAALASSLFLFFAAPMHAAQCFSADTAKVEEARRMVDQDDPVEMNRWYKFAIDSNHAGVIRRLARTNFARQDYQSAFAGYEKGAYLGDFESMYDLGIMWLKGEGREADPAKGYAWYRLAGEYIPKDWDERYFPAKQIQWYEALAPDLKAKLTPEQVEAGDRYYEAQKTRIVCDWYAWYKEYMKTAKKRP